MHAHAQAPFTPLHLEPFPLFQVSSPPPLFLSFPLRCFPLLTLPTLAAHLCVIA